MAGTIIAACSDTASASQPVNADDNAWASVSADPSRVMVVAARPSGARAPASENSVTSVGPTPSPISSSHTMIEANESAVE